MEDITATPICVVTIPPSYSDKGHKLAAMPRTRFDICQLLPSAWPNGQPIRGRTT